MILAKSNIEINKKGILKLNFASIAAIKKDFSAWIFLLPSLFLFVVILWQPIVTGIILSFYALKGYDPVKFVGILNYIDVLSDTKFLQTLLNTVMYVFWSLCVGFLPPIIIAIVVNELVHFKSFFKFSIYFPVMVPSVAAALLWSILFQPGNAGVFNMILSKFGLPASQWLQNSNLTIFLIICTMTWRSFGSTTILYIASLQGINQELYEASVIDGAGILSRIKNITIPQIANIILLMFVRQIIGVFQIMVEPMTMTDGGPSNASMTLSLQGYNYAFRYFQPQKALALGVVMFVMLSGLTIVYFKLKKKVEQN